MKKTNQQSSNVKFDKTELKKSIIYKFYDKDNSTLAPRYFTLQGLTFYVTENLWDYWEDIIDENDKQEFTKSEILANSEYLFAYLEYWNYKVERITIESI
jgi:hypothetical protein